MAKFTDKQGRDWVVVIPFSLARRKKAEGVDLLDPKVVGGLLDDHYLASDLLFWICEDQAKERGFGKTKVTTSEGEEVALYNRGLSADEFGNVAFEVREDAWAALLDAVRDFFQQSGNRAAAEMITRGVKAAKRIADHAMVKVEGGAFEKLVDRAIEKVDLAIAQLTEVETA
jgi:hypothetical protein